MALGLAWPPQRDSPAAQAFRNIAQADKDMRVLMMATERQVTLVKRAHEKEKARQRRETFMRALKAAKKRWALEHQRRKKKSKKSIPPR